MIAAIELLFYLAAIAATVYPLACWTANGFAKD